MNHGDISLNVKFPYLEPRESPLEEGSPRYRRITTPTSGGGGSPAAFRIQGVASGSPKNQGAVLVVPIAAPLNTIGAARGINNPRALAERASRALAKESTWVRPQQIFTWANTYLNVKNPIGIVLFIEMILERCGARPQDGSMGQKALIAGEVIAALGIMLASNPYNTKPIQDAHAYYGWTLPHKAKKMARLRVDYWDTSYVGHAGIVLSSLSFAVAQALLSKQGTFYISATSPIMYTMMAMIGASYMFPSTVRANHALNVLGFMCCNRRLCHNTSLPRDRWPLAPLYLAATLISLPYSYPIGSALLGLGGLTQVNLGVAAHFTLANIVGHPFIIPQAGVTADELYKFLSKLKCSNRGSNAENQAYKGGFSLYNILALLIAFFAMALTTFALAFKQFQSGGLGVVASGLFAGVAALKFIAQARPMVKHLKRPEDGWKDLIIPPAKGTLHYERHLIMKLLQQWEMGTRTPEPEAVPTPHCCDLENQKPLAEKIKRRYKHFLAMVAITNLREESSQARGCTHSQLSREGELAIHQALKDERSALSQYVSGIFSQQKSQVITTIKQTLEVGQHSEPASATVWPVNAAQESETTALIPS